MPVDPGGEDDPAGQFKHALAPDTAEYLPAGHSTHVLTLLVPGTPENEPAGHDAQTLAFVASVTPEYVPSEQFVHALTPGRFENVPATHFVHALALVVIENSPTGQAVQKIPYNVVISWTESCLSYTLTSATMARLPVEPPALPATNNLLS